MRPTLSARVGIAVFMNVVLAATFSFLGSIATLAADAPRVLGSGSASDPPQLQVLSKEANRMVVQFTLPAVAAEDVQVDGETFQALAIPGGGDLGAVGAPMLPTFARFVMLPDRAGVTVTVHVEEEEELTGFRVFPMQDETSSTFAYNPAAYARVGYGNEPIASVGEPALLRGVRVAALNFTPVQYDPSRGTLRIARRVTVDVQFAGEDLRNVRTGTEAAVPSSFDRIYTDLVLGYESPSRNEALQHGTYLMICPNNSSVISLLTPLLDWRRRQGYPVHLATTAETGTSAASIKAYIQTAYNTWTPRPEFIALVGDASGSFSIPTWNESYSGIGGEGDHPYTQLDGSDMLSDAHVGRLSFNYLTELETIVAKTVRYETAPNLSDAGWFTRACLVGDPSHSGYSTVQVMQWIKTRLRQIGYTQVDTVFSGSYVSQMSVALNRGDSFFAYRGYIGMSGWTNTNTGALINTNKVPFALMSTCGTGGFQNDTARSEAFLRAGTPDSSRGAIGAVGTATSGTHTRFNNCYTLGTAHGVFYDDLWETGAAHTRGKYELYLNYSVGAPSYVAIFSYWNSLMGDPACPVWTAFPVTLAMEYPAVIPVGTNAVTVRVTENGNPSADTQVCLYRAAGASPELQVVGLTDAGGYCTLPIPAAGAGTIKLTAWKHNALPARSDLTVADSPVFVSYYGSSIDDDGSGASQGNGDALPNAGETIELGLNLKNFGTELATDVTATISCSDPYVTITGPGQSFGTIGAGASTWGAGPFVFSLSPSCPHGRLLRFDIAAASGSEQWHSIVDVSVIAADIAPTKFTLFNSGNGTLDPGETLEASLPIRNLGGAGATGVTATLSSLSAWVTLLDSTAVYGDIAADGLVENAADRYTLSASLDAVAGQLAFFRLVTQYNAGLTDTSFVSLTVGVRSSDDPIGPDRRGYLAFDNTDVAYPQHPNYSWIEINPALGGPGTQVTLGDYGDYQDKSRAMDLPFPFQFYGQTFTRATVCTNGWIAMGDTYLTDYRNWNIPGAGAPQNLIAVFWDDLIEVSATPGHVYTWYDETHHLWIVEWSRMKNIVNSATETCQAILYDPVYHPTSNGDGIIVFQYAAVANVDTIDGFSTVGIQNATQTDGLLYTYWASYPQGAPSLMAGRAIRFQPLVGNITGAPEAAARVTVLRLEAARPSPFTGSTALSFSLPEQGKANLAIYDVQGREVRTLIEGPVPAGTQTAVWDGQDARGHAVPAGAYFCRLESGGQTVVRKLVRVQ